MNKERKSIPKIILQSLSFIFVFVLSLNFLSTIFAPKNGVMPASETNYITNCYKAEDKNTVDVFFVGNSDLYRAVSPPVIWKNTNISSCVSGKGCQTIHGAYKITKNMYKNQSPSVVFIETDMMFSSSSDYTKGIKRKKRWLDTKRIVQSLFANFDDAAISGMSYYFPLFKYHDRWQKLESHDIIGRNMSYKAEYKGFISDFRVNGYHAGFDYMKADSKPEEISSRRIHQFDKLIELCEKNGSKVVFLEVPSASSWSMSRHNAIQNIADKYGIQFIDFNIDVPEGFDWSIHSIDGGDHLNTFGAQIISTKISDYINSNFNISEMKKNNDCVSWPDIANRYMKELNSNLKTQKV